MSTDNLIKPELKNPSIQQAHEYVCRAVSDLRGDIGTKRLISNSKYRLFKKQFDYLYIKTGNRKDMVTTYPELIENVNKWLITRQFKPDRDHIDMGIELFRQYQKALYEQAILTDKTG